MYHCIFKGKHYIEDNENFRDATVKVQSTLLHPVMVDPWTVVTPTHILVACLLFPSLQSTVMESRCGTPNRVLPYLSQRSAVMMISVTLYVKKRVLYTLRFHDFK